jgi:hypothetical protein
MHPAVWRASGGCPPPAFLPFRVKNKNPTGRLPFTRIRRKVGRVGKFVRVIRSHEGSGRHSRKTNCWALRLSLRSPGAA